MMAQGCGHRAETADGNHPGTITIKQAEDLVWQLPEVQAWAKYLRTVKEYPVHGCTMDLSSEPWENNGHKWWAVGFYEDQEDHVVMWEAFVVRVDGGEIMVEDRLDGHWMSLDEWRRDKNPMARVPKASAAQDKTALPG